MAKCDLCGGDCRSNEMTQLREQYVVPGVRDLCPGCDGWANSVKSSIVAEIAPRLRAAIAKRKNAVIQARSLSWWIRHLVFRNRGG